LAENYFKTLYDVNVKKKVKKKNNLNYLSWSAAWAEVKKIYPDATYHIYERETPESLVINYFTDGKTCWVKTGVTINGIEHIEDLPVMDFKNQSIKLENVTSSDVNKAIQRSLTKACARHGLGLYIYEGEDLPEAEGEKQKELEEKLASQKNTLIEMMGDIINDGANKDDVYAIIAKYNGGKKNPTSIDNIEVCEKAIADIKKKYKEKK
jgi:hypothetical protein